MKKALPIIISTLMLVLVVPSLISDISAQSENAPGQNRRVIPQTGRENTENPTGQGGSNSARPTGVPNQNTAAKRVVLPVNARAAEIRVPKLGILRMREALKAGSESAGLTGALNRPAKIQRLRIVELSASAAASLRRHALTGEITDIQGGVLTLSHQIQRERVQTVTVDASTIVMIKGTETATVTDLTIGMRIAAVGEPVGGTLLAKRIHVIPERADGLPGNFPTVSPIANPTATTTGTMTPSPTAAPSPGTATPTLIVTPTL